VCGSGSIAPRILNFGTRWWWLVNFTPLHFFFPEKQASVPIG